MLRFLLFTSVDGENHDQIIGFAIVPVESEENYLFLINGLKAHPLTKEFLEQEQLLIVSDRHRGLLSAINCYIPRAISRYCSVHLQRNARISNNKSPDNKVSYSLEYYYKI